MKRINLIFAFILVFALSIPQVAYANMAAPKEADIGSSITFEKNDAVSVLLMKAFPHNLCFFLQILKIVV